MSESSHEPPDRGPAIDTVTLPETLIRRGVALLGADRDLPEVINAILDLVVEVSGSEGASMELRGLGVITVGAARPAGSSGWAVDCQGAVIGRLVLHHPEGRPGPDAAIAAFAVDLVAAAWSHHQRLERERAGREEEQGLVRAGQVLARTINLRDVLPLILEELGAVVPYDTASVQELRGDRVVVVGGVGIDPGVLDGLSFAVDQQGTPNSDVVRRRRPVIVRDIYGDHPYWDFPDPDHARSGVRCWMGVPLVFGQECVGMLALDKVEPDFYTEHHARLAAAFASQAAIALENARAFGRVQAEVRVRREAEERLQEANTALRARMAEIEALQEHLREQSVRDPLTGVFNRRYLMETLDRELPRSRREGVPLAVAVIDVDHFKVINDRLGHDAGDRVLVGVAEVLDTHVRDEDVVCRYGGEEFVVVLPGSTIEVARRRAERWQAGLAALPLPASMADRPVTISVGLAAAGASTGTAEQVVRAADQAMYRAKHRGRNRIEVAALGPPG